MESADKENAMLNRKCLKGKHCRKVGDIRLTDSSRREKPKGPRHTMMSTLTSFLSIIVTPWRLFMQVLEGKKRLQKVARALKIWPVLVMGIQQKHVRIKANENAKPSKYHVFMVLIV